MGGGKTSLAEFCGTASGCQTGEGRAPGQGVRHAGNAGWKNGHRLLLRRQATLGQRAGGCLRPRRRRHRTCVLTVLKVFLKVPTPASKSLITRHVGSPVVSVCRAAGRAAGRGTALRVWRGKHRTEEVHGPARAGAQARQTRRC